MSKTMVFRVDEELEARIRERASRDEVPVSNFLRTAVEQALATDDEVTPYESVKHLIGKFSSGRSDLASDHSRIIKERLRAKHNR